MNRIEIATQLASALLLSCPDDYAGQPESILAHDALSYADALIKAHQDNPGPCVACNDPQADVWQHNEDCPFKNKGEINYVNE